MADLLSTALSGLAAFQRSLAITGHNIANVNTEGYSRQRVEFEPVPPVGTGSIAVGRGVEATRVRRIFEQFAADQLKRNIAEQSRLDAFATLAAGVDNLLGNPESGLSQAMQGFFEGIQAVANDPASMTARQVLLGEADTLTDRFAILQRRLLSFEQQISGQVEAAVGEINALATSLAKVNAAIVEASGSSAERAPNDLLDQRELLLSRLSEQVAVSAVSLSDGSVNVFIGSGQPLVLGGRANALTLVSGDFPGASTEIAIAGSGAAVITQNLSGGVIGGLLDVRRELLDPARNSLGQIATGLAQSFNSQHRQGMDVQGNLGGDFFVVDDPQVIQSTSNTGSADLDVSVKDVGKLTIADYVLHYDGTSFTLTRLDTGVSVAMTGVGSGADPFVADGLSIEVSGAAAAGDRFMIRPTQEVAGTLRTLVRDPDQVAAAAPIRTTAEVGNRGDAEISSGEVLDVSDPNLLATATIEFITPATYMIDGAGSFAYVSGSPIDINGTRVRIEGAPQAGDRFVLESNAGGVGDNRNALALGEVLGIGVLDGASTSLQDAYGRLVSRVGTVTRQAQTNLRAQSVVTDQSREEHLAISGVNLDEEAANLVKFQQAYQAAAQLIRVADTLFLTVLGAVRR